MLRIIPPMTSQFLVIVKNTTLALAVGYPDLAFVIATTINQTGQAVEGVLMLMGVFLSLRLLVSLFMNWYNRRVLRWQRYSAMPTMLDLSARAPASSTAPPPAPGLWPQLFGSAFSAIVSIGAFATLAWLALRFAQWGLWEAVWPGAGAEACRDTGGACWAFLGQKYRQILFGIYPLFATPWCAKRYARTTRAAMNEDLALDIADRESSRKCRSRVGAVA